MNKKKIETILLIVLFSTVFSMKMQAQSYRNANSNIYDSNRNIIMRADNNNSGMEGIQFESGKGNVVAQFNVDDATFFKKGIFSNGIRVDGGQYQSSGPIAFHPDLDKTGDDSISFRNSDNQEMAKIQDGVLTLNGENRLESSGNLTFRSGMNSFENDIIYFRNGNNAEMATLQDGFFKLQGESKISASNINTSNLESEGILNLKGSTISFKKGNGTQQALLEDGVLSLDAIRLSVTSFPDYVFGRDYQLMPLEKVASYIKEHKHLPNMPSEAEVVKEGMNVGQINTVLVEKVEELTLYTIAQDQKLAKQEEQLKFLLKSLATLEKKINSYK